MRACARPRQRLRRRGGASRNAAPTLEHCDGALGTLTVVEDQAGDWHHYLTGDLRLGSTIPVIRLLVQQSNCFVLVERGRAMGNVAAGTRADAGGRAAQGQQPRQGPAGRGRLHARRKQRWRIGELLGAFGGKAAIAGALVSGLRFKKAATILTLIDNCSGVPGPQDRFRPRPARRQRRRRRARGVQQHARRPCCRQGLRRCLQPQWCSRRGNTTHRKSTAAWATSGR